MVVGLAQRQFPITWTRRTGGGTPVSADQTFVMAINNYRQSGGGGFPGVTTAPVIYNQQKEIRQLIIDWVSANQVIDPAVFHQIDWTLTYGTTPLQVTA